MKSLWKTILDGLTYQDLAGRRQPRAYTVITGIILLLILSVAGLHLLSRYDLMREVSQDPKPITVTLTVPYRTSTPRVEATPLTCPTDPEDWSLSDVPIKINYKVIQPNCVYQGLEKTIAWALAVRNGYSRGEATTALGFDEMPMRRLDQVTVPYNDQLLDVPVSFIPPHPDFTEWRVSERGEPSVVYALRGCFRTSTVTGNRVEIWGGDYPVICVIVEDAEGSRVVYQLEGHTYTATAIPMRSFLLFGYVSDGLWVWLGTQEDPKKEIEHPEKMASERLTIATLYDLHPWDLRWLKDRYRLTMKPLPENWRALNDQAEMQAILSALNAYVAGGDE